MIFPWQNLEYQQIVAAVKSGNQSIMLSGVKGIGKKLLAQEVIKYLLCNHKTAADQACQICRSCTLYASNNHPDIFVITDEEGKNIKQENIKKLLSESLATTPNIAAVKIVYIPDFKLFSTQGANTLLKTLEEPPPSLIFIMVVDETSMVLPTILSRCIKIGLKKPNNLELKQYLSEQSTTTSSIQFWQQYFYNVPLVEALFTEEHLQLITACLLKPSIKNIFKASEEFDGKKISFAVFIDFISKWIAELLQRFMLTVAAAELQYCIFAQYPMENLFSKIAIEKIFALQDEIQIFSKFSQHPLNYKLQIENILFKYQMCFMANPE